MKARRSRSETEELLHLIDPSQVTWQVSSEVRDKNPGGWFARDTSVRAWRKRSVKPSVKEVGERVPIGRGQVK